MISCIIGLHGTGKTWFMVNILAYPAWLAGENILSYNQLNFSNDGERVQRFWQLSDLYTATNALIVFPELQKLLNAQTYRSLPPMFADYILSQHRHAQLNLVGDTQDLMLIDPNLRRHIAELYVCKTILRLPKNEAILPYFHWISVQKKIRRFDLKTDRVVFEKIGRPKSYFISRFWTKKLYDTYEKSQLNKFIIWVCRKKKKWTVHMINRQLISAGKRRR